MTSLIRLYPRAWRARYGDELEDLVGSRKLGMSGTFDMLRGAVDAHRHPELVDPGIKGETPWSAGVSRQRLADLAVARRLGLAAWAGAIAWIAGWVIAANGPIVADGDTSYRSGDAGAPVIFLAVALLSAGLIGQLIRIAPRARLTRVGALVAVFVGPLWAMSPWVLVLGLILLIALTVLALGAWWADQWSGSSALTVLASIGTGLGMMVIMIMGAEALTTLRGDPMLFVVFAFTPIWIAMGGSLRRLPPLDRAAAERSAARVSEPA